MATVIGDDNGVIETCDEADAACNDCDWVDDGAGMDVIASATEHVEATRHSVGISCTYYGSVEP